MALRKALRALIATPQKGVDPGRRWGVSLAPIDIVIRSTTKAGSHHTIAWQTSHEEALATRIRAETTDPEREPPGRFGSWLNFW